MDSPAYHPSTETIRQVLIGLAGTEVALRVTALALSDEASAQLASMAHVAFLALGLLWLGSVWESLNPSPEEKSARSGAAAVLLQFVPFYGPFWALEVHARLADRLASAGAHRAATSRAHGRALAALIATVAGPFVAALFPAWGWLLSVLAVWLWVAYAFDVDAARAKIDPELRAG